MDEAQRTLAEELAAPLIMLVLASVVALVGWLLSRQLRFFETTLEDHENRHDKSERDILQMQVILKLKRPSDLFKTVPLPPHSEESSA